MVSKLSSDADLKAALTDFFERAEADEGLPTPPDERPLFVGADDERPVLIRDGAAFAVRAETTAARNAVILRCTKLLGAVASHEQDISDVIWSQAAHRATTAPRPSVSEMVAATLTQLGGDTSRVFTYVDCNYLFRFHDTVDRIAIGPVIAARTPVLAAEIARHPDAKWTLVGGDGPAIKIHMDGTIEFVLTPLAWAVTCRAARRNVGEHALWLIDVAISYLRLSHQVKGGNYPDIGEPEVHPVLPTQLAASPIMITGYDVQQGVGARPAIYDVDAALAALTEGASFKARAMLLFGAKSGSVGERVAQGLGWLTRGRRTGDRAERLLYAFTAMEALLSGDDKSAPVVQTIARHAAAMLWDDAANRASGAKQIRDLYAARSALVHAGARKVSKSNADTAQWLAEMLFWQTLNKVPLDRKLTAFHDELAVASYGSAWPPAP